MYVWKLYECTPQIRRDSPMKNKIEKKKWYKNCLNSGFDVDDNNNNNNHNIIYLYT